METLAYLYGAETYEQPEEKELNLSGLKAAAVTGLVAAGVTTAGVVGQADSASAHCYRGGCGSYYRPVVWRPVYYRPCYYRPVYHRPCCY